MSMIDSSKSSIGVGNYKGVMLCNRPFGGTAGNIGVLVVNAVFDLIWKPLICCWSLCTAVAISRQVGTSETNAFNCGVVADALGINVPISNREKVHRLLCIKIWKHLFPFESLSLSTQISMIFYSTKLKGLRRTASSLNIENGSLICRGKRISSSLSIFLRWQREKKYRWRYIF